MKSPLVLHLKAALICALAAVVLALPLLWLPALPGLAAWRLPVVSPRAEAVMAILAAVAVAWCVVDIPRRGLKILIWLSALWLLGGGIWLAGLYGYDSSSLVPLTAAALAGAGALAFSFSPAGSRRARWQSLVGPRVAPEFLRSRVGEQHLEDGPRAQILAVAEVLWPVASGDEVAAWPGLSEASARAAALFQKAGGYLERCDAEGAVFVFGLWGQPAETARIVETLWQWAQESGGCAALARGECVAGVGKFPDGPRWTLAGAPMRKAKRMASAARGYAARVLVEEATAADSADQWDARRIAWWDLEGERVLLHEITGPADAATRESEDRQRWDRAWEAFWSGDWAAAENLFAGLARDREDQAARVFAMRSSAARAVVAEK